MKKILMTLMLTLTVNAGVLVEPYVGYQLGSGDAGAVDYTYNSPVMGARLGYTALGFMGGLDYSLSMESDLEAEASGVKTKEKFSGSNVGLFAGYELPILLRAWATYYFSAKAEDQDGGDKGEAYKGDGLGLGVGFTGLPFVSLNLEYRMLSFDKYDGESLDDNLDINMIMVGVSLPLDL